MNLDKPENENDAVEINKSHHVTLPQAAMCFMV